MKATLYFLVRVENDYNNYVELSDGSQLMVNNSIDDVETINRVGKVISVPHGVSIVEPGDMLLFHHNICRASWGLKGKKRPSVFYIKDNVYYVPVPEVMMYMKEGAEDWEAIDPFVFVKPIPTETKTLPNGLEVEEKGYKGRKHLMGILAYPNSRLRQMGAVEGDTVVFQQDSEHEYKLKGEIYYKMRTQDILAVI